MKKAWPEGVKKAVLIAIPHTSNWDLLYARAAFFFDGYSREIYHQEGNYGWAFRVAF